LKTLGSNDLFCLFKGFDGFQPVSEEHKRELLRSREGKPGHRRP
jgi:hypothetical protein